MIDKNGNEISNEYIKGWADGKRETIEVILRKIDNLKVDDGYDVRTTTAINEKLEELKQKITQKGENK